MPMGVASMSLTRAMPGASTLCTCAGSGCPAAAACKAGTRLSKISVVLPEPDTPVTTVSRPLGSAASSGCTVWMAPVARRIAPCANTSCRGQRGRSGAAVPGSRNGPMRDAGFWASAAGGPWAMTVPPSAPAPGPSSTIWPAWASTWVSWSTSSTVLPSATRSSMTAVSPLRLAGCRPMDGSSNTYSTPVVRLRTARASCMRWRSPVESVDAARSSAR